MDVLDKYNIVPLNQLPKNSQQGRKNDFILPMILLGAGIFLVGIYVYKKHKDYRERRDNNFHKH